MKKIVAMLAVTMLFVLSGTSMAAVELKFAHGGSLEHQYQIGAEYFKKLVEERSNGEIKVNIFPQGQLGGSERELLEGVRMGTIEIVSIAAGGALPSFVPEFQVLGIPYLFQSREQVYAVLDGEVGDELGALMLGKGFQNLAFWEVGFRNFTNNIRPIEKPEDIKGLKIRVQESKSWMEFIKMLGGIPTPISFGELYSALQQKVVDGQENPIATIYSMKYYEVQKYLTLDGHTYEAAAIIANPKWFSSLSEEHQKIIKDAARDAATYQREKLFEMDQERLDFIRKAGVEIVENPDKEAFAQATADLYKVLDNVPEELINKIKDAAAKVK
ncbi:MULTISPECIES: DctP family TRAP transporter solute-binding subunit [Aminobacterium]|uniref:TRAP transporter substrate-binding protein n=1 Tax=Aminobacterium TaxID=81466 RepID=UPI0004648146|nr:MULTISPECIES: DctP family TRAP transporter solute-binding subunit [Aminobacterium]